MTADKERYTTKEEHFEIELNDLKNLVIPSEQDPYSERPMEYLGQ